MRQGQGTCLGDDQSLTLRSALPEAQPIWEVALAARARAEGLGGNPLSTFTYTVEGPGSKKGPEGASALVDQWMAGPRLRREEMVTAGCPT